jgi:hypothetical protein
MTRDPTVRHCTDCRWARVQTTAKGSRFWRCLRAEEDPTYRRYPPLPVLRCTGHESANPPA